MKDCAIRGVLMRSEVIFPPKSQIENVIAEYFPISSVTARSKIIS